MPDVGLMRFHGQDSAYVFVGDPVEAYCKALHDHSLTDADLAHAVDTFEVSYEIWNAEQVRAHDGLLSVDHMV